MGATPSQPAEFNEKRRVQAAMAAQAKELADNLASLDLNEVATSTTGTLEGALLEDWEYAASKVDGYCSALHSLIFIPEPCDCYLKDSLVAHRYQRIATAPPSSRCRHLYLQHFAAIYPEAYHESAR